MNLIGLDVPSIVHTHGFEVAWARVPALVQLLRRIGKQAMLVTVVSEYTRRFIDRALGTGVPVELLRTGVDLERFHPGVDGSEVRKRHGLAGRPVVVHVSRLVARKGQDVLIRAMEIVRREVPDAAALIVGGGSDEARLRRIAAEHDVRDAVAFAGEVREEALAAHYAAGDVFAMPCRSRWADLEVEGLGLVYLEAQACARPAIAGDSGGAPEAVVPGETGFVVPGRDHRVLAERLVELLGDPARARAMGEAGRRFVEANHRWDDVVARLRGYARPRLTPLPAGRAPGYTKTPHERTGGSRHGRHDREHVPRADEGSSGPRRAQGQARRPMVGDHLARVRGARPARGERPAGARDRARRPGRADLAQPAGMARRRHRDAGDRRYHRADLRHELASAALLHHRPLGIEGDLRRERRPARQGHEDQERAARSQEGHHLRPGGREARRLRDELGPAPGGGVQARRREPEGLRRAPRRRSSPRTSRRWSTRQARPARRRARC